MNEVLKVMGLSNKPRVVSKAELTSVYKPYMRLLLRNQEIKNTKKG